MTFYNFLRAEHSAFSRENIKFFYKKTTRSAVTGITEPSTPLGPKVIT